MRLSLSVAVFLLLEQSTSTVGFSLVSTSSRRQTVLSLSAEPEAPAPEKKKPLTAAAIMARARKAAGLPDEEEEEEAPKLFEDSVYVDMQQILLTLEKRAKDGPGSLSPLEVEEFQILSERVLGEMKVNEAERLGSLQAATPPPAAPALAAPAPVAAVQVAPVETAAPPVTILQSKEVTDTSNDEGPEFDGTGGFGLAKGTRNTYVIEGMDEMSPDEYQEALRQMVCDQHWERKKSGAYGNRSPWDYLNSLSGESGMFKDEAVFGDQIEEKRPERVDSVQAATPPRAAPAPAAPAPAAPAPVAAVQAAPARVAPVRTAAPPVTILKSKEVTDTSNDEGPEFDGTGGFGLAKGTRNTYVIPGMDEMSPDEYQEALRQMVCDQHWERKKSGAYGNRSPWDYLNSLSGESGMFTDEAVFGDQTDKE
jgi:hypothetical protein